MTKSCLDNHQTKIKCNLTANTKNYNSLRFLYLTRVTISTTCYFYRTRADIAAMLLFTLQLEALEITPTSPLVPYINWLYPRTQAEF